MNQKELREIRKRFNPDKESFSRIYGCYVNGARQIVSEMDMSLGLLEKEETELYLKILKKTLSGNLGRNLIDIEFSTDKVERSDEHKLLQALRLTHLKDENVRNIFYQRVIESADMGEDSYVILLASDSYDIPFKGTDDEVWDEGSSEVFDYFICCICPVKDAKAALRYYAEEKSFKGFSTGHVLGNPEFGFMFPAFDDRSTNIYSALYYSRNIAEMHKEFSDAVFNVDKVPMSAAAQKNAFGCSLETALGDECSLDVIRTLHGEIRQRLQIHKENKEPETPEIYLEEVDDILKKSGINDEKIESFNVSCENSFGDMGAFNPGNIIESKKFEMETPEVKITVDPEYAFAIQTKVIDGSSYILIPAGEGVEVNGIPVSVEDE